MAKVRLHACDIAVFKAIGMLYENSFYSAMPPSFLVLDARSQRLVPLEFRLSRSRSAAAGHQKE